MHLLTIILIAVGLAMDAFAASVTNGINSKVLRKRNAFKIATSFGFFQLIMPIIGWQLGTSVIEYVKHIDHWIAAVLLGYIGGKMIYESRKKCRKHEEINSKSLLILSIATSIDALAVGLSLALIKIDIWLPAIIIGIVTFSMSLIGVYVGHKARCILEKKADLAGGAILIFIGLKILAEHITAT